MSPPWLFETLLLTIAAKRAKANSPRVDADVRCAARPSAAAPASPWGARDRERLGGELQASALALWRHPAFPFYAGAHVLLRAAVGLLRPRLLPPRAIERVLLWSASMNARGAEIMRRQRLSRRRR